MRLLPLFLVLVTVGSARPLDAQWSTPAGVTVTHGNPARAEPMAMVRGPRITWIDFSSGLLGAIIGFLVATALCDDDPERNCPAGAPAIGGAIGAAIGIGVGRAAAR